ncbi:hypothetical protein F5888DRAFT_1804314 [Russula emetica]|nr:hypothetical protein F5888DRAFT_1804314 [Russula emetica]
MVDFNNPITIAREFGAYALPSGSGDLPSFFSTVAAVNVWHTFDGIFIWEFFTTFGYEWDVIRGHRPYRWTIWVYSLTRFATLMAVIFNMVNFDNTGRVNCEAWNTINTFFAYVAFASASLLIVLRIIAIWNKERIVVLIATGVWLADVAFLIYGTAKIHSVWSDESNSCVLLNPQSNKVNIIFSLVSDVILLLIMLAGLLRMRVGTGDFDLRRLLWNQSLVWLVLATVAEVPPVVFFCLNLNGPLDLMFQCPNMVIMAIGATRMYRSLINLGNAQVLSEAPGGRRTVSKLEFTSQPVPLKQMPVEVSLQTDTNQYPKSQSGSGGLDIQTQTE